MIKIRDLISMDGKICVVTGGSTGLGSYMAEGFLAAGAAKVYITARTEATLETKASELSGTYEGECIAIVGDLATLDGVAALSTALHQKEPHIDLLINNAGIGTGGGVLRSDDCGRLGQDDGPQPKVTAVSHPGVA